ncbi:unnamed protein product [Rotaria socialis]|uniref:Disease resistance R13L4/SHOC-2-like LRR domain-containing protein n=1 Tax=Rotaria socialis TaxID=392032 RepID=A0A818DA66_9BILA|nr:unnamed protein product [Rotaria socialis]
MPLLNENNMELELENFYDEDDYADDDYERFHGLLIRRKTSYSTQTAKSSSKAKLSARQQTDTIQVDRAIACALKAHPKTFKFTQKGLQYLPPSIKHLSVCDGLRELDLYGNQLKALPDEIGKLKYVEICNLGNNHFEDLPIVLGSLPRLIKLLLFNNHLGNLSLSLSFSKLSNLRILNLNNNAITQIPSDIGILVNLEILTIEHNQLVEIPREIGLCTRLIELHFGYNCLTKLPLEIGYLIDLKKLVLHRNNLLELPESITNLKTSLNLLDVACNNLRIFPSKFHTLHLKEFYAEHNPLLEHSPIHSIQENEILTLKELCARHSMNELRNPTFDFQPTLRDRIQHNKKAKDILMQCTECQFCHNYFLNTWLECVEFIDVQRTFKGVKNHSDQVISVIPQRALLCSYECFNSPGHNYYGVAFT